MKYLLDSNIIIYHIASTAQANDLTLVTRNTDDFKNLDIKIQ